MVGSEAQLGLEWPCMPSSFQLSTTEHTAKNMLYRVLLLWVSLPSETCIDTKYSQIETENGKKTLSNLEKILEDYKAMRQENSALAAKIREAWDWQIAAVLPLVLVDNLDWQSTLTACYGISTPYSILKLTGPSSSAAGFPVAPLHCLCRRVPNWGREEFFVLKLLWDHF